MIRTNYRAVIKRNHSGECRVVTQRHYLWQASSHHVSPHWRLVSVSSQRHRNFFQGLLLLILLGLLPGMVWASEIALPAEIKAGSFFVRGDSGVTQEALRLNSEADFNISGMIARVRLQQQFKNTSAEWMEGVYVFPLPEQAAVDRLNIQVGERRIEGVIKERAEAKAMYQRAKSSGQRTALVEQERPNLFTTSVANIAPGETVVVEISYQQMLHYQRGRFSLRFPMTLTPRYIPGEQIIDADEPISIKGSGWSFNTDQVRDASRITPPVRLSHETEDSRMRIKVTLDAGMELSRINSLYHDIEFNRQGQVYSVELLNGAVAMDRDFELVWQPALGAEPEAALFKETIAGEDYALIMLMPPVAESFPVAQQSLPREVVFIIDTSGSMAGVSMQQARAALLMALKTLQPVDRFNIIEFNSVTRRLFSQSVQADQQSLDVAQRFVQNLRADGGTEMKPAIEAALDSDALEGYVRQVVFMTDGSVGNETALFALIENKLQHSRLFTVGIGSAPNSYFMRKAAEFGRGSYTYIRSQDEVYGRMQALFAQLQSPQLSHIQLNWSGESTPQLWPQRLPDLYRDQPLLISAKLDVANTHLTVSGRMGGQVWQRRLALDSHQQHSGVAVLWARNQIADWMDQVVRGGQQAKLRQQIVDLALKHQMVSKYTSLVVVDPVQARARHEGLKTAAVANRLPLGSQQRVQGYGFPQTATASELQLLLGFGCIALAMILILFRARYEK